MDNKKQPKKTSDKRAILEQILPEDVVAAYKALFELDSSQAQDDKYSLAQPHAFRFVPSVLSGNTSTKRRNDVGRTLLTLRSFRHEAIIAGSSAVSTGPDFRLRHYHKLKSLYF